VPVVTVPQEQSASEADSRRQGRRRESRGEEVFMSSVIVKVVMCVSPPMGGNFAGVLCRKNAQSLGCNKRGAFKLEFTSYEGAGASRHAINKRMAKRPAVP
jgi:hypothetical protein